MAAALPGWPSGSASVVPEPTHLPGALGLLLNVLFFLLFRLPWLSRRQLQEHMETAWQLLGTDAGLCSALFPPLLPVSECFSGCLDVSALRGGTVCFEVLVGFQTLGDWLCGQDGWVLTTVFAFFAPSISSQVFSMPENGFKLAWRKITLGWLFSPHPRNTCFIKALIISRLFSCRSLLG